MRAAIVRKTTNLVTNVIEIEEGAQFNPGDKYLVVPSETAEIGDVYRDGGFHKD